MFTLSTPKLSNNLRTMTRETYHHGSLRPALIKEARALLDEGGPSAVTLREAARRAGVSATATYRHFRDKDALLASVAAEGFREFASRLEASVAGGRPFAEMGRAYVTFAIELPGLFRLMFSPLMNHRDAHPELAGASERAFAALQSAAKGGEITPAVGEGAAITAWSLAHGLAHLMLDEVLPAAHRAHILVAVFGPPYAS